MGRTLIQKLINIRDYLDDKIDDLERAEAKPAPIRLKSRGLSPFAKTLPVNAIHDYLSRVTFELYTIEQGRAARLLATSEVVSLESSTRGLRIDGTVLLECKDSGTAAALILRSSEDPRYYVSLTAGTSGADFNLASVVIGPHLGNLCVACFDMELP